MPHESEEKLRAHFLHTGTPSATGLLKHVEETGRVVTVIGA